MLTCRLHRQSKRDDSIQRLFPSLSFQKVRRKYFVTVLSQVALAAPGRSCRWHPWPAKLDQPGHSRGPARPFTGPCKGASQANQGHGRAWRGCRGEQPGQSRGPTALKGTSQATQGDQPSQARAWQGLSGLSKGPAMPVKGLAGPGLKSQGPGRACQG